jgi:hypothetical protein
MKAYEEFKLYEEMWNTLTEDSLADRTDGVEYEYKYFLGGSAFKEDQFKQKLILALKAMKSISSVAAIPQAVDIIVQGLKEGAELKGFANFELGDNSVVVKALKKTIQDGNSNT